MLEKQNILIVETARQAQADEHRAAAEVRKALRELCAAVADLLSAVDSQAQAQGVNHGRQ